MKLDTFTTSFASQAKLVEHGGAPLTYGFMTIVSLVNVALVVLLARWCRISVTAPV